LPIEVRAFAPDEWDRFRDLRLRALREDADAFTSTYAREVEFDEATWRARTGAMAYATRDGLAAGIVGAMPDEATHSTVLIAMWVAPEHRGAGVADALVAWVCAAAQRNGHTRVGLWYADGNATARRVYERLGFVEVDGGKLPGRLEEHDHAMTLELAD
jgi:predicted GNAT family acetyltransferase